MKKRSISILILWVGIALIGCSSGTAKEPGIKDAPDNGSTPGMEGYVVAKEDRSILVVSSVPKDFSGTGGVKEFYDAIWFSNAPKNVSIGQKAQVWYSFVQESYPGQSRADNVTVLPDIRPEGARLTEAEAIAKALSEQTGPKVGVPVIKRADHDQTSKTWTITIKYGEDESPIRIEDE